MLYALITTYRNTGHTVVDLLAANNEAEALMMAQPLILSILCPDEESQRPDDETRDDYALFAEWVEQACAWAEIDLTIAEARHWPGLSGD